MKPSLLLFFALLLFACTNPKNNRPDTPNTQQKAPSQKQNIKPEFQSILDTANIKGAILIYDLQADHYYSNDFSRAREGQLPASTFKIPNAIIALETGVVKSDSTLFEWDGKKRSFKIWEQDLIFRDAFRFSCVPCFQEIARKIGESRMKKYLKKLDYKQMVFDAKNLDLFWLEGASRINQFQQIDFLKRLYHSQLPISERTQKTITAMMLMEEKEDFVLRGKTGWSVSNDKDNGWFVGYAETGKGVYFFATNVEPKVGFDGNNFGKIRKSVTREALGYFLENRD